MRSGNRVCMCTFSVYLAPSACSVVAIYCIKFYNINIEVAEQLSCAANIKFIMITSLLMKRSKTMSVTFLLNPLPRKLKMDSAI